MTKTFALNTSSLLVRAFAGKPTVELAALEFTFDSEGALLDSLMFAPMKELAAIFNNVAKRCAKDAPTGGAALVKRFKDRTTGVRRIWEEAQLLPVEAAEGPIAKKDSKKATVLAMLSAKAGATAAEIMQATGWQKHTVRGFIAGTVKTNMGLKVEATREGDATRYRIVPPEAA